MDTNTEEGRSAYRREYETLCELAPELLKKEDLVFPHEQAPYISNEPHFQRVWQHYREHIFRNHLVQSIESGVVSQEDADAFRSFVGLTG